MATNGSKWNPYRDPRTGRFTTATALAATRRVHRLTTLGGDLDALCPYDVDLAALTILHAAVNTAIAWPELEALEEATNGL